jgi:phosphoenolpyruvate carboxykinase (GTP)
MAKQPKIFHVNWFRVDKKGKFLWPGFGENLRVLEWILNRCNSKVGARETAIGYVSYSGDIDTAGLPLPTGTLEKLLSVNNKEWLEELKGIKTFFSQFKKDLPQELWLEYNSLSQRLRDTL